MTFKFQFKQQRDSWIQILISSRGRDRQVNVCETLRRIRCWYGGGEVDAPQGIGEDVREDGVLIVAKL